MTLSLTNWQKISVKELDLEAAFAERQVCGLFTVNIFYKQSLL